MKHEQGCADFSRADLREADLMSAGLGGANFSEADLYKANVTSAYFWEADLRGANLGGVVATTTSANFRGVQWAGSHWSSRLVEADFSGAFLIDAKADEADLSLGYFHNARLERARFRRANLGQASFRDTDMSRADLMSADLRGAYFRDTK